MQYICFDTETTGLSPKTEKLIEIAAVKVDDESNQIIDRYCQRINPILEDGTAKHISSGAQAIHNISNTDLETSPSFADIAPAFIEFLSDLPVIAHNIRFDVGFLFREFNRLDDRSLIRRFAGLTGIDTMKYSRDVYGYANSIGNSLDALASRFSIDTERRKVHGALLDSEVLAEVVIAIQDKHRFTSKHNLGWLKDTSFIHDIEYW